MVLLGRLPERFFKHRGLLIELVINSRSSDRVLSPPQQAHLNKRSSPLQLPLHARCGRS